MCNKSNCTNKIQAYSMTKQVLLNLRNGTVEQIISLCHKIVDTSTYSETWKTATIKPKFKSGDQADFKNYRPITTSPILSKIADKIFNFIAPLSFTLGFSVTRLIQLKLDASHSQFLTLLLFYLPMNISIYFNITVLQSPFQQVNHFTLFKIPNGSSFISTSDSLHPPIFSINTWEHHQLKKRQGRYKEDTRNKHIQCYSKFLDERFGVQYLTKRQVS